MRESVCERVCMRECVCLVLDAPLLMCPLSRTECLCVCVSECVCECVYVRVCLFTC